jgi:hypothetical protein
VHYVITFVAGIAFALLSLIAVVFLSERPKFRKTTFYRGIDEAIADIKALTNADSDRHLN